MEDYKIAETPKYIFDSLLKDRFLFVCYENIPQEFSKSELYLIILNYLHFRHHGEQDILFRW